IMDAVRGISVDALRGHAVFGKVAECLRPRQTLFTHISHELDYEATNASLPPHMQLAHDGQRVPLT
ncbi:MAG: hypothetical protein KDA47_15340, partial [Planctomycetales bacterium]|nr:hypothetical protein [Planctomycetales bacterium]